MSKRLCFFLAGVIGTICLLVLIWLSFSRGTRVSKANVDLIQPGMSEFEVQSILGPPSLIGPKQDFSIWFEDEVPRKYFDIEATNSAAIKVWIDHTRRVNGTHWEESTLTFFDKVRRAIGW